MVQKLQSKLILIMPILPAVTYRAVWHDVVITILYECNDSR